MPHRFRSPYRLPSILHTDINAIGVIVVIVNIATSSALLVAAPSPRAPPLPLRERKKFHHLAIASGTVQKTAAVARDGQVIEISGEGVIRHKSTHANSRSQNQINTEKSAPPINLPPVFSPPSKPGLQYPCPALGYTARRCGEAGPVLPLGRRRTIPRVEPGDMETSSEAPLPFFTLAQKAGDHEEAVARLAADVRGTHTLRR